MTAPGVLLWSSADSKYSSACLPLAKPSLTVATFNKLRPSHCCCCGWGNVKVQVTACSWPHLQCGLRWESCPSVRQHRACPEHCRKRQNYLENRKPGGQAAMGRCQTHCTLLCLCCKWSKLNRVSCSVPRSEGAEKNACFSHGYACG